MTKEHEHDWIEETSWADPDRRHVCTGCGKEKRDSRDRMQRAPGQHRQITNPGRERA